MSGDSEWTSAMCTDMGEFPNADKKHWIYTLWFTIYVSSKYTKLNNMLFRDVEFYTLKKTLKENKRKINKIPECG